MMKWFVSIVVLLLAHSTFAVTFIPLRGEIEVKTFADMRSGVVTVNASGSLVARFCLSFPQRLERPINLATRGEVVYLPQPIEGLPPGTRSSGPEPIAQTLTVIPEGGQPIAFVAKGVKPIVPGSEIILIHSVSREDSGEATNAQTCGAPS
jgi:hypothetical protein